MSIKINVLELNVTPNRHWSDSSSDGCKDGCLAILTATAKLQLVEADATELPVDDVQCTFTTHKPGIARTKPVDFSESGETATVSWVFYATAPRTEPGEPIPSGPFRGQIGFRITDERVKETTTDNPLTADYLHCAPKGYEPRSDWQYSSDTMSNEGEVNDPPDEDLAIILRAIRVDAAVGSDVSRLLSICVSNLGQTVIIGTDQGRENGYKVDLYLTPEPGTKPVVTPTQVDRKWQLLARIDVTPTLEPGTQAPIRLDKPVFIPQSTKPGNYLLCAVADPENRIKESNERNNISCVRLKITRRT